MPLTGLSFGSMKKIFIMISNSPQPVSVISYGGFVTTGTNVILFNCYLKHLIII